MSVVLLATLKNIMETKEVFCGLIFNKDKGCIYNPREQNRVAWPEFFFLQKESWSSEIFPFFFLDTPPVPNYSMLHFSTMRMVIKCIYLCFCIGETVSLQIDVVHSSLKQDKFILARAQFISFSSIQADFAPNHHFRFSYPNANYWGKNMLFAIYF